MKRCVAAIALTAVALSVSLGAAPHRARHHPPVIRTATPAPAPARPALWKVADEDTTIYLFGTIHALPPGIDWLDGKVANAFENSGELITEIVDNDSPQVQQSVMAKAMLPKGQSLRSLLTPAQKQKYEQALLSLKLPVSAFDMYKPWYAAIALATFPLVRDGYGVENGVEGKLDSRAKALGRPHSGLETFEYQLGLFDSLPMDVQQRYLIDVANNLPSLKRELDAMVQAWRRGDAARLAQLMNDDQDDPAMMQVLIINRNKAWAEWIGNRLARPGISFVAVGAGHLAGNGSVQDQLAAKGLKVTRVQ